MDLIERVKEKKEELIKKILNEQSSDGAFRFCYESGVLTDSFMIMILRTVGDHDETLIKKLVKRILSTQEREGYWKLYADETEGDLSETINAYNALLFSGYVEKNDPRLKKAAAYIRKKGGLKNATLLCKVMMAINGQYPWPPFFKMIPISLLKLPPFLPFSFFDLSSFARIHFVPVMVVSNLRYTAQTKWTPDLSHLLIDKNHRERLGDEERSILQKLIEPIKTLLTFPSSINQAAYDYAEDYMLKRIEPNGTLYSYASSTFVMIYALLALGYEKDSQVIQNAVLGLKSLIYESEDVIHVQNSPSTVWDTALLSYVLQEAGVESTSSELEKTNRYLLEHQQTKYRDWAIKSPDVRPGGWGFSDVNTMIPDVDDTTAALRAIQQFCYQYNEDIEAWNKGLNWVFGLQNNDGGWPAFEKNTDSELLQHLPWEFAQEVATDPSSADLTGRTLEFLGNKVGLTMEHNEVNDAVNWLIQNQNEDGSWYGRWGICYIYGTWAAVTGMMAVGVSPEHPSIQKAAKWLTSIQREDGGWGESCKSDQVNHYVPLNMSTLSQTAWATDALIAIYNRKNKTIDRGISLLVDSSSLSKEALTYPTGAGLPGEAYTYYHSYNNIWPLLALSHYSMY